MGEGGLPLVVALGLGYLLGSVPFGLLLTKAAGLGDIRSIGSGNIGATNVLRTGNKKLAAATLALDVLKGTVAVLAAGLLCGGMGEGSGQDGVLCGAIGGFGAFLGHVYPVWLGFKGGKGVATYIGILIGLSVKLALIFCATWLSMAILFRYSSLSALVAAIITPVAGYLLGGPVIGVACLLMSALLIYKHEANIKRLIAGEEPKIGGKG